MIRAFSHGGGVQSMAALVLSAKKVIDFPLHIFSNTGNDSENPETLVYIEEYTKPFAVKYGIEFVEVAHPRYTLLEKCMDESSTIPVPVYMGSGAPGRRNLIYLSGFGILLSELAEGLLQGRQLSLFDLQDESCGGYCWT